jgi:hypothetical protein
MKGDPSYLFQVCTRKASLGVLSVGGNFCGEIISNMNYKVKENKASMESKINRIADIQSKTANFSSMRSSLIY